MSTTLYFLTILSLIFLLFVDVVRTKCAEEYGKSGIISQTYTVQGSDHFNYCWRVLNPLKHKIRLEVKQFNFYQKGCNKAFLKIKDTVDGREGLFCDNGDYKSPFFSNSDVEIHIFIHSPSFSSWYNNPNFELQYEMATCQNPRQFYGEDLIKRLLNQLETSANFTHPGSYLALCNANVTWPERAVSDLISILNSDTDFPFVIDIQSYAVMAIACNMNKLTVNSTEIDELVSLYKYTIEQFKERQHLNGSFGNFYLTALLTQALLASGEEFSIDWNAREALTYITENLFYPRPYDFQFVYLSLPLLNRKSLEDISILNCKENQRNKGDLVSEISHYLGKKIEVKYSLFVGEEKDITHTMSFQVPKNFTAYQVMKLAEMQNQKYKFDSEMSVGRLYVYAISGIPNDPETGRFWLLYLGPNSKRSLTLMNKDPDELVLENEDYLIMWYRKTQI